MEEATVGGKHEIVEVPVSYSQDVCHDAVSSAALQVGLMDFWLDPKGCCMVQALVEPLADPGY